MGDEVSPIRTDFADLCGARRDSDNPHHGLAYGYYRSRKVKARIVNGLFDRLDYLEETQTEVPLGAVFAPICFTRNGPEVKVGLAGACSDGGAVRQRVYLGGHQPDAPPDSHRKVHAGFRILTPFGGRPGNCLDVPGHRRGYRRHGARTVRLYQRLRL